MLDIDLIALQCFIEVVDSGSFSLAAGRMQRSQSAISQQIAKLEKLLKKPLLNRENFELSPTGHVLYDYAKKINRSYLEMMDQLVRPELTGILRFGLPEDIATAFLSEYLMEFRTSHPCLFLQVECDLTLNLMKRFKQKEFDLVVIKTINQDTLKNSEEILSEKLVWVASKKNFDDVNLSSRLPLVLSPKPCIYRARAEEALNKAKLEWQVVYSSPSYIGSMAAVEAGLGITVLPRLMIPDGLKEIKHKKLPNLQETHICFMVNPKAPQSVHLFKAYIKERLGS